MQGICTSDLINLHSYLRSINEPSEKAKEILTKLEEKLYNHVDAIIQLKPIN